MTTSPRSDLDDDMVVRLQPPEYRQLQMVSNATQRTNRHQRRARLGVLAAAVLTMLVSACSNDDQAADACALPAEWQDTPFDDVTGEQGVPDASELRRLAMMGGNVVAGDEFRISAAPDLSGTIDSTDIAAVLTAAPVYVVVEDRAPNTETTGSMGIDWCVWTLRSDVGLEATLDLILSEFPQSPS